MSANGILKCNHPLSRVLAYRSAILRLATAEAIPKFSTDVYRPIRSIDQATNVMPASNVQSTPKIYGIIPGVLRLGINGIDAEVTLGYRGDAELKYGYISGGDRMLN
jgi:hypothetical protein